MLKDTYGEVINGEETYSFIARQLLTGVPVLIGWTDNLGTHFDILFNFQAFVYGNNIQGGISSSDLYVSIMRRGAFGFDVSHENTHGGYYGEKLYVESSSTQEALAQLINGIKRNINLELK